MRRAGGLAHVTSVLLVAGAATACAGTTASFPPDLAVGEIACELVYGSTTGRVIGPFTPGDS